MNQVTILLCTVDRTELLVDVLYSIRKQKPDIPVVVVDNAATKNRSLEQTLRGVDRVTFLHEPVSGLSHARNKGIAQIATEWILLLDDDVRLPLDFFERLAPAISSNNFDCFGGYYLPFYPEGRPAWLPDSFGRKTPLRSSTGSIDVFADGFLSAGIFCVRKSALDDVGGFDSGLGMNRQIGYGEEDDLQIRLQQAGYRIAFIADWWLYHAVLAHKHSLRWHLRSAFARGRDGQRIHQVWHRGNAPWYVLKGLGGVVRRLVSALRNLLTRSDYYWQNLGLDILGPFLTVCGRAYAVYFYRD